MRTSSDVVMRLRIHSRKDGLGWRSQSRCLLTLHRGREEAMRISTAHRGENFADIICSIIVLALFSDTLTLLLLGYNRYWVDNSAGCCDAERCRKVRWQTMRGFDVLRMGRQRINIALEVTNTPRDGIPVWLYGVLCGFDASIGSRDLFRLSQILGHIRITEDAR